MLRGKHKTGQSAHTLVKGSSDFQPLASSVHEVSVCSESLPVWVGTRPGKYRLGSNRTLRCV